MYVPGGKMGRKRSFKDKIGMAVYEKRTLNRKIVNMQKSFQEVKHVLSGEKK